MIHSPVVPTCKITLRQHKARQLLAHPIRQKESRVHELTQRVKCSRNRVRTNGHPRHLRHYFFLPIDGILLALLSRSAALFCDRLTYFTFRSNNRCHRKSTRSWARSVYMQCTPQLQVCAVARDCVCVQRPGGESQTE